jgi:predicted nucleic acid-binding protein
VNVPRPVEREVLRRGMSDAAVEAIRTLTWLNVVDPGPVPDHVRQLRLDVGEEAVLTWALTHPGALAIMDDRRGRRAAHSLGAPVVGVLGLILEAKLRGSIPDARSVVDHLLATTDWYLGHTVIEQALNQIGE